MASCENIALSRHRLCRLPSSQGTRSEPFKHLRVAAIVPRRASNCPDYAKYRVKIRMMGEASGSDFLSSDSASSGPIDVC